MPEKDHSTAERASSSDADPESQTEQHTQQPPSPNTEKSPIPIGWEGGNDPGNPHNWSTTRKTINVGIVCLLVHPSPGVIDHYAWSEADDERFRDRQLGTSLFHRLGLCVGLRFWAPDPRAALGNIWTKSNLQQLQCAIPRIQHRVRLVTERGCFHSIPIPGGMCRCSAHEYWGWKYFGLHCAGTPWEDHVDLLY